MNQANLNKFGDGNPKPNVVKFAHNWNNKLDAEYFTTIRKPDVHFKYYSMRIGEPFSVLLNGKKYCRAILVDSNVIEVAKITPELLVIDTGTMEWKKLFEKFGVKDSCCLLLFRKIEDE